MNTEAIAKQTILIVDDLEANRDVLQRYIERFGHNSVSCESGAKTLEILRQQSIDIVLLDYMMPEMNGYQVLLKIKENPQTRHVPVIMISAANELEKIVECIQAGAEDYLAKPFNPTLLKARLQSLINRKELFNKLQAQLQAHKSSMLATAAPPASTTTPPAAPPLLPQQWQTDLEKLQHHCREISELLSNRRSDMAMDMADSLEEYNGVCLKLVKSLLSSLKV